MIITRYGVHVLSPHAQPFNNENSSSVTWKMPATIQFGIETAKVVAGQADIDTMAPTGINECLNMSLIIQKRLIT